MAHAKALHDALLTGSVHAARAIRSQRVETYYEQGKRLLPALPVLRIGRIIGAVPAHKDDAVGRLGGLERLWRGMCEGALDVLCARGVLARDGVRPGSGWS